MKNRLTRPAGSSLTACSPSDPFVRHEVVDRASILIEMLDRSLGAHPGMVNGNLREIYERAETALSDLYQEAGRISFEENLRRSYLTAMSEPSNIQEPPDELQRKPAMKNRLTRMWVNQPSTLQQFHELNGQRVLAQAPVNGWTTVWFVSGPVESQSIEWRALSPGWIACCSTGAAPAPSIETLLTFTDWKAKMLGKKPATPKKRTSRKKKP